MLALPIGVRRVVVCCLLSLVTAVPLPMCVGGEGVSGDLALLQSLTHPPGPLIARPCIREAGFSPKADVVACFSTSERFAELGTVHVWDVKTGRRLGEVVPPVPRAPMPLVRYSLSTVPHARLSFWTMEGLEVQDDLCLPARRRIPLKLLRRGVGVEGRLHLPIGDEGGAEMGRVYFSANDEYLAAFRYDKSIHVWNARTGEHVARFCLPPEVVSADGAGVRSLAFDPTNRYLAAGEDQFVPPDGSGAVIVWDLKTRREVLHTKEQYRVFQVAFSASGDLICVGGGGGPSGLDTLGAITIRKAAKYDVARTIGTQCGVTALAVVPGVGVATGDWHGQVRLWDLATGRALAVANESGLHVNSLAASQDGKLLLSGDWDSTARLWRTSAAKGPK